MSGGTNIVRYSLIFDVSNKKEQKCLLDANSVIISNSVGFTRFKFAHVGSQTENKT